MIKHLLHIFTLCCIFFMGVIAGRLFSPKPSKIVATTQVNNVTTQKTEVVTQAEVKKDSTTAIQTITILKTYSNTGKLATSTYTETKFNNKRLIENKTEQIKQVNTIATQETKTKTITTYQPNWEFGVMLPVNSLASHDYTNSSLDIGYRIIGNLWARSEIIPLKLQGSKLQGSIGAFILL